MNYCYIYGYLLIFSHFFMINGMEIEESKGTYLDKHVIYAADRGDIAELRNLIGRGANINARDKEHGATALHYAMDNKDQKLAEFLLIETPIEVNAKNKLGSTALIFATFMQNNDLIKQLLQCPRVDVNIQNYEGNTALHFAVESKNTEIIELLLAKGAKANILNNRFETARGLAQRYGNEKIIQMLEKSIGIDQLLIDAIRFYLIEFCEDLTQVVKNFIAMGANVNAPCKENPSWNSFHYAIHSGLTDVVKVLMHAGARVDTRCENGFRFMSPDKLAEEKGHYELASLLRSYEELFAYVCSGKTLQVKSLLDQGLYVNARYAANQTLLHRAVQVPGCLEIVKLLLSAGADMTLQNDSKRSAFDCARSKEVLEYFQYIQLQRLAKLAREYESKRKCVQCQKPSTLIGCDECREISYCSPECQKAHLPGHKAQVHAPEECPICFGDLDKNEEELSCRHRFHKACIADWKKRSATCLLCKRDL